MFPRTLCDPAAFWTMILVGVTGVLAAIAFVQIRRLSKISSADFIHKFKVDFFSSKDTRDLFTLIENQCIRFRESPIDHFRVFNLSSLGPLGKQITRKLFSTYEIDDFLLGHFEDLGLYEQKGIVDIEMVYELFDTYLERSWESEQIQKYIQFSRQPNKLSREQNADVYDKFEYICAKCKSFGEAKVGWTYKTRKTQWIMKRWWKLKWWLRSI
jgi:hypothetical protein